MADWRNRIIGTGEAAPGDLIANPKNWRTHPKEQRDAIAGIMAEVGVVQNVIVNRRTGNIVDGHARVEIAIDEKQTTIPVVYVDLTEAEEAAILALLDPIGAMAGSAADRWAALLADVTVSSAALLAILAGDDPKAGNAEPDAVPALPEKPRTKPGDLWLLGEHRLLCGDATQPGEIARLIGGGHASMLWTDPPYGVEYVGKTADALTLQNDGAAGLPRLLAATFAALAPALAPGAPFYIAHPAGPLSVRFGEAIEAAGWKIHETLVWVKNAMVLGHSDYHYRHEPIFYGATDDAMIPWFMEQAPVYEPVLYGWTPGAAHPWYGNRSETSVFMIDRPKASREHPTMKPSELVERCLRNSSLAGGIIIDPFVGSGTTIVACERLGRICYAMEIEPKYCDVVVDRWQAFTGETARRERRPTAFVSTRTITPTARSTGSPQIPASTGKTKARAHG